MIYLIALLAEAFGNLEPNRLQNCQLEGGRLGVERYSDIVSTATGLEHLQKSHAARYLVQHLARRTAGIRSVVLGLLVGLPRQMRSLKMVRLNPP